ncbi:MAG: L-seryl-tRNA(Sec) selenium transferase [Desulfovibrio sp.]|jgi:L-seryl-tRNA(Ser) seleniumtransferase|nr:L-seryl-tRNA(Sec) selenium transferase [Desulfovibrio sp.]
MENPYRSIPSVDVCLSALEEEYPDLLKNVSRSRAREIITAFWDDVRRDIKDGRRRVATPLLQTCLPDIKNAIRMETRCGVRPVLNATGVVIHTNLGRSILPEKALQALTDTSSGYCSLELNRETGGRGSRHDIAENLLKDLCGAEAAVVVNNNAAAVLLVLNTLCEGGEVIVSRGELVEIGGSFRIPEIMERSGSILREVGTTNRTYLRDYEVAVTENTKALLRVHTSNYRIVGFHSAASLPQLAALGRQRGLLVIEDLGSGCLVDLTPYGLPPEPTVASVVSEGADMVMFSGDKALGGPQAGIVVGRKDLVDQLKLNPLMRALRCDKLCLTALEATLRQYCLPDVVSRIPTLRMITASPRELAAKAKRLATRLRKLLGERCAVSLRQGSSRVGGGAFPECDLPTTLICITPAYISANELKSRLLACTPPLLGRMEDNAFCLDTRTLRSRDCLLAERLLVEALSDPAGE